MKKTIILLCFALTLDITIFTPVFAEQTNQSYTKHNMQIQEFTPGAANDVIISVKSIKDASRNTNEKNEYIALILKEGVILEDTYDEGRIVGFEGNFSLAVLDESGNTLSMLDDLFDGYMAFSSGRPIEFCFSDYNGDGDVEFIIGQSKSNILEEPEPGVIGYAYKMYAYSNGKLREISINNGKYFFMSSKSDSDYLDVVDEHTFKTMEYRQYNPTRIYEHYYQWEGNLFVEIKVEEIPLVSEENLSAKPEQMSFWPEHRISVYTLSKLRNGQYTGFYLYVNGKETYFPEWTSFASRTPRLCSIQPELDPVMFGIIFITGYGTSVEEGHVLVYNAYDGSIMENNILDFYLDSTTANYVSISSFDGSAYGNPALMISRQLIPESNIITQNSRCLLPLSIICDRLGADTVFDENTNKIIIIRNDRKIEMTLNEYEEIANNVNMSQDIPAQKIGNTIYVPLRFVAENLSAVVGYYARGSAEYEFWPFDLVWIDTEIINGSDMH